MAKKVIKKLPPIDIEALVKRQAEEERVRRLNLKKSKVLEPISAEQKQKQEFSRGMEAKYQNNKFAKDDYLFASFYGIDLEFLKNLNKACQKKRYPKSPILNEYLFLVTLNHKLHITAVEFEKKFGKHNTDTLELISKNADRIKMLERELSEMRDKSEGEKNLVSMHKTVVGEAKKYIKDNIGLFSFKCKGCGEVVMSDGLPHWALYKGEYEGNPYFFVWSKELWYLIKNAKLPIHIMAFVLKTSIQGIKFTCKTRDGDKWHLSDEEIIAEEKLLKKMQEGYRDEEMPKQQERVSKLGTE